MGKNIGKNLNNTLSGKYNQKPLDNSKQSATEAFKTTPKRPIEKTGEKTDGSKFPNRISNIPKKYNKIVQRQLQKRMTRKYPENEIYIKQKDRKLLIV